MIHQLRIYEIFERNREAFHARFRDEAARDAAWKAFMADAEWIAIKRRTAARHGDLVGAIEDRTLRPLDYSPAGRSAA